MQAALERSRGSRDQIFLELELQVGPCPLRVSVASLDGRRLKGPILPVCTSKTPSFRLPGMKPWF